MWYPGLDPLTKIKDVSGERKQKPKLAKSKIKAIV